VTATFGRHHRPPWGVDGGKEGSPNRIEIYTGDGQLLVCTGTLADYPVPQGVRIRFITATGGGWGDPLQRDPALVAQDVVRGYISPATARDDYGVVLDPETGAVDRAATQQLRADMAR
jgi:N-methylhydantoinase B